MCLKLWLCVKRLTLRQSVHVWKRHDAHLHIFPSWCIRTFPTSHLCIFHLYSPSLSFSSSFHFPYQNHTCYSIIFLRLLYSELLDKHLSRSRPNRRLVFFCSDLWGQSFEEAFDKCKALQWLYWLIDFWWTLTSILTACDALRWTWPWNFTAKRQSRPARFVLLLSESILPALETWGIPKDYRRVCSENVKEW